jgi:heme oxygenase
VVAHLRIVVPSSAFAYGAMYVIEGSALGGQTIAERVWRRHGIGPHGGASFFGGRGEQTAAMWREFRHKLVAEVGTAPAAFAQAEAGAHATFDGLTSVLDVLAREERLA